MQSCFLLAGKLAQNQPLKGRLLTTLQLLFYSFLPGFSISSVTEDRDSCLRTINRILKHPLFLEFCIASVVI